MQEKLLFPEAEVMISLSSNLLKYGYNYQAPSNTDKRIIDTNELVAKRINALSTVLHPEGFIGGLQAEDVSSLIEETGEEQVILKAEVDTSSMYEAAQKEAAQIIENAQLQADTIVQES